MPRPTHFFFISFSQDNFQIFFSFFFSQKLSCLLFLLMKIIRKKFILLFFFFRWRQTPAKKKFPLHFFPFSLFLFLFFYFLFIVSLHHLFRLFDGFLFSLFYILFFFLVQSFTLTSTLHGFLFLFFCPLAVFNNLKSYLIGLKLTAFLLCIFNISPYIYIFFFLSTLINHWAPFFLFPFSLLFYFLVLDLPPSLKRGFPLLL